MNFDCRKNLARIAVVLFSMGSVISLSCNSPFQPELKFTPKLVMYSLFIANSQTVAVRLTSTVSTSNGLYSAAVHGANVELEFSSGFYWRFKDTTLTDGNDTVSVYIANMPVMGGTTYRLIARKEGYDSAYAAATVPVSYVTIPDQHGYTLMKNPINATDDITLMVSLSSPSVAELTQLLLEYRGIDGSGRLKAGMINVLPVDSLNPFSEVTAGVVPVSVPIGLYTNAFKAIKDSTKTLSTYHLYADIVITQVDDSFYRFFVTSTRGLNPLDMRTDKVIFTDISGGQGVGVVAGAAVDTTRVFLF